MTKSKIPSAEIKKANEAYLERWKLNGGQTRNHQCPHCLKQLERTVPKNKGEVWTTAMMCAECGKHYFAIIPYRGKIKTETMEVAQ